MIHNCPECGFVDAAEGFIHDKNPPHGNSGIWCPNCEISLEFADGKLDYYLSLDKFTMDMVKSALGKSDEQN